ncbi:hypothetical protein SLA2020_089960 [Shorea laevis]
MAGVWFATIWTLWMWRNRKVFGNEQDKEEEVQELIKYRSFYWVRANLFSDLQLESWKADPKEALRQRAKNQLKSGA